MNAGVYSSCKVVKQTLNRCPSWLLYILKLVITACTFHHAAQKTSRATYWSCCVAPSVNFATMTSVPRLTLLTPFALTTAHLNLAWITLNDWLKATQPPPLFLSLCFQTQQFLNKQTKLQYEQNGEAAPAQAAFSPRPRRSLSFASAWRTASTCIRINTSHMWESAGSRCCTDPIISTSDGLPGSQSMIRLTHPHHEMQLL